MLKSFQFLLALFMLQSFSVKAETDVSPFCPTLESLNATTRFYYDKVITDVAADARYKDQFLSVGINAPFPFDDLRLLETITDSAVCQKLNERFADLDLEFVYDRELHQYAPAYFVVYYELQDRYIVFRQPYSAGSDREDVVGPPTLGWTVASIYDKKNLNFLGNITF